MPFDATAGAHADNPTEECAQAEDLFTFRMSPYMVGFIAAHHESVFAETLLRKTAPSGIVYAPHVWQAVSRHWQGSCSPAAGICATIIMAIHFAKEQRPVTLAYITEVAHVREAVHLREVRASFLPKPLRQSTASGAALHAAK